MAMITEVSNYTSQILRASAATSGASEQDDAVTLPDTVRCCWVRVQKTAEANVDNLLTVRLQARLGAADWVDLPFFITQATVALTTAADGTTVTSRVPNIVDASSDPTIHVVAYYDDLPSNIIRTISISSGTTPANTWEAEVHYRKQP